jgi:hypothetical protein
VNIELPSEVTDVPWLDADSPAWDGEGLDEDRLDPLTTTFGKWLLYVARPSVDEVWAKVAELTVAGRLGPSSKVSTCYPTLGSVAGPDTHVICVYAADWRDVTDLRRILEELRRAGLAQSATHFKRDRETWAGAYGVTGHRGVCVWNAWAAPAIEYVPQDQAGPSWWVEEVVISTKWLTGRSVVVTPSNQAQIVAELERLDNPGTS